MKDIFYFKKISSVGGCESFFWYLAQKYDFTLYYREAAPEQIKRLSQLIECRKYKEPLKCDKFFCCYGLDIEVEAPVKKHIIHCDYKGVDFKPIQYPGFEYIGVSKLACDSFQELTGKEAELIYNPIYLDIPKAEKYNDNKLHFISATRLTKEKGLKRLQKLASIMDKAGIDYEWVIYTNRKRQPIGKNVIYKDSKLDILNDIAKSDALIQLSDCEAFCYSIVESLMCSTPVICTDLPVFKEIGVKHGENAIVCNLDMNNVDLEMIKNIKNMKFTYKPPKENWDKYLSTERTYDPKKIVKVRMLKNTWLTEEDRHEKRGNEILLKQYRASYLEAKGLVERL